MLWCTYIECTRNDEVGKQMCSFVRHGKEIQADVYGAASIELWKTFKEKMRKSSTYRGLEEDICLRQLPSKRLNQGTPCLNQPLLEVAYLSLYLLST